MNTIFCLVITLILGIFLLQSGLHSIEEGHVGVYWRGGALLKGTTDPGFHWKIPFIDSVDQVQVTMQTDSVTNIPCGTSGGTVVHFEKIEVVNRLRKEKVYDTIKAYGVNYDRIWIFDKIHHEINQFCSKHTLQEVYIDLFDTLDDDLAKKLQADCDKYDTGIDIIAVRVTKPRIPDSIRKNYEAIETEKTRLMVAIQTQKVVEKEAETERMRATIEATKQAEVAKINMEREINTHKGKQQIQAIEDKIVADRMKSIADAEYYAKMKAAEADKARLTPEYLQLQLILALANNTKIYFGDKIPAMGFNLQDWGIHIQKKEGK